MGEWVGSHEIQKYEFKRSETQKFSGPAGGFFGGTTTRASQIRFIAHRPRRRRNVC
jgi:hypothetical protein